MNLNLFFIIVFCISQSSGYECPDSSCTGVGCTCDTNCQTCNNNVCDQCKISEGYFKVSIGTKCLSCNAVFGDECLFCQDYYGCAQCADGYTLIEDSSCNGMHYCFGGNSGGDNSNDNLNQFSTALYDMFDTYTGYGIDTSYATVFIEWADEFDKLTAYTIDGSDNYAQLFEKYTNYVNRDNEMQGWNTGLQSDVMNGNNNDDGELLQNVIDAGFDPYTFTEYYVHNSLSDLSDDDFFDSRFGLLQPANNSNSSNYTTESNPDNLVDDIDGIDPDGDERRRLQFGCASLKNDWVPSGFHSSYTDLSAWGHGVTNQIGGTCWAHASTGQFEINYNIEVNKKSNKFSEYYTVDCGETCLFGWDLGGYGGGWADRVQPWHVDHGACTEYGYESLGCSCNSANIVKAAYAYKVTSFLQNVFPQWLFESAARRISRNVAMSFDFLIPTKAGFWNGKLEWTGDGCSTSTLGSHSMLALGQKTKNGKRYIKVRNSWGTWWANGGYAWFSQSVQNTKCKMSQFQYNLFSDNVKTFPITCPSKCDKSPCSESQSENCRIYHTLSGCEQCENGYFQKTRSYPCESCQKVFGGKCLVCNSGIGCSQCVSGYTIAYGDACGLQYCK